MQPHEYAPGRTILAANGEDYLVQDVITGSTGNDWLIITQDRDLGPSTLVQAGHVKDTWFPVEPEEPVNTSPTAQAQADAERLRNEKKKAKAEKKARKAATRKAEKKTAKPKATAAKPKATPAKAKARARAKAAAESGTPAPGPAAVSV